MENQPVPFLFQIASIEAFRRVRHNGQVRLLPLGLVSSRYRKRWGILSADITAIRNRTGELK